MLHREDLRGYQKRATRFLRTKPFSGLFLDMGLGKTATTLTAINDCLEAGEVKKVLLVGPLKVVQGVWRQEARKWSHLKHMTFKLIEGREEERLNCMKSTASVHLINVENLRWLLYVIKSMSKRKGFVWPYDTLVIDESSLFKSAGSKRFGTLRFLLKHFKRRHILTGTPAPNGLIDVWSQMFIVDEGQRLGTSVSRYKSRFFRSTGYMGYKKEIEEGSKEVIARLISPVILTMRAEDYLDLPPLLKSEVWVDLPPAARTVYDKLEKEMFLELDKGSVEATHAATLTGKCHQLANGAIFLKDALGSTVWEEVHKTKLEALDLTLREVGSNALVAYYYKHDLERLRKAYPKAPVLADAKTTRQLNKMQDEWNAGKHPVMLVHPQGAGHGLNLQDGGYLIIFYSLLFGHEPYRQVIERIGPARQVGKARHVLVKHILARDTVDEALLASQVRKFDDERSFVKAIKEYREVQEMLR